MAEPLSVLYLLDDAPLFGGVKVVLRQADLLARRGHRVAVVSRGDRPDWYEPEAPFLTVPDLAAERLPPADVVVATYWTTIAPALRSGAREVAHYCQGFEAIYTHNQAEHPAILAAYRSPLPGLAVAPHLVELLRARFGRPARVVRQPLEPGFAPRARTGPGRPPRLLVPSPYEIDWKGVDSALRAVAELRREREIELVRLSQWPAPPAEREVAVADEFHCHLPPAEVPELVAGVDLVIAPSWEAEGFGLPVLEAMASGVPVVATAIPSYEWYAAEAAVLVPPRDPSAIARAVRSLLDDGERWQRHRAAGLAVAARFHEDEAASDAEGALRWIASGAWRNELDVSRSSPERAG